jgi:Outer membrane protein beta-barrel domain
MRLLFQIFLLFTVVNGFSQELTTEVVSVKIDSLYREDQFYVSVSLNSLQNKPIGLTQEKFSPGFSFGFLRDMPINKKRTFAIAPGLGFSFNNYNQNLAVTKSNETTVYKVLESDAAYSKNKFSQLSVEVPLEFRWRSSTYENHKFWRIHGGFKMSYLLYDKSVFQDQKGKVVISNNTDFNKLQYGAYIASGYNTINVYAYYGLNPLFQSAKTSTESIDMNSINFGVMFYIL